MRSNWIGLGIGVALVGGVAGILWATGTVSVTKNSTDGETEQSGAEANTDSKSDKARGRRKKNRKNRRNRKNKNDDTVKQLSSMGYVDGTVDEQVEHSGVVINVAGETQPGINFYASRKQSGAQLVDMQGIVLHEWENEATGGDWQHVSLLPDGSIIGLIKDKKMFKVDKDSKILWTYEGRVHHDLDIGPDGHIFVLSRSNRMMPKYHDEYPTVDDVVVEVSPDGEEIRQISVLGLLEKSPYSFLLNDGDSLTALKVSRANPHRKKGEFDILHSNHVEVFDGSLADKNPIFAKGNLLLSPRNTHTVIIANPETEEILWAWGSSQLIFPHHPTVTDAGTILVFNNGTKSTGSQVLEVDPATNDIVWSYGPTQGFHSLMRGSNIRMDNGNTLITESDTGYVFEVTPEGKTVWEFRNPHVKKRKKLRMAIWRMDRVDPKELNFDFNRAGGPGRAGPAAP